MQAELDIWRRNPTRSKIQLVAQRRGAEKKNYAGVIPHFLMASLRLLLETLTRPSQVFLDFKERRVARYRRAARRKCGADSFFPINTDRKLEMSGLEA